MNLPINLFDVALVAILGTGIWRGRKHGMSEELIPLLKWAVIMVACALAYQPLGQLIADKGHFSTLFGYITAYIGVGIAILSLFALVKRGLGGKLLGSDLFGGAEYYLGMVAGFFRFFCMLMAVLALLNARYYSQEEIQAELRFQNDVYGSDFFPGFQTLQATVFRTSLVGPLIKQYLGVLLIKPTVPEKKEFHQKDYQFP